MTPRRRARTKRAAGAESKPAPRALIVAGVMSGTSADGVDVVLCRVSPPRASVPPAGALIPEIQVLGHRHFPYAKPLRAAVLAAARGEPAAAAEFARLSWRLGEVYALCVETAARELKLRPQLVACHGQTVYHQAAALKFLKSPLRCTWQIGAAAPLTERLRVPVIHDFRPADLAAGGQAAPLVPMLDFCRFRHAAKNRLLLNLGGIANVTALPAGGGLDDVLAFDTGPANMVIDACMQTLFQRPFDKHGAVAARGRVLPDVLKPLLQAPFFAAPPPKSCGREEFGAAFAARFLERCQRNGARGPKRGQRQDTIATATALTVETIRDAYRRFCWPHLGQRAPLARATELLVAGGGARNATLMRLLSEAFAPLGVTVTTTDAAGSASSALPIEAKEAAAFALLGWLTWHGLPGNVPSATGARRSVVLGSVSLP